MPLVAVDLWRHSFASACLTAACHAWSTMRPRIMPFPKLPLTPFRVGAHLSTPVVLANGKIYGTLCCFSQAGDESLTRRDLQKLACVAKITAKRIDVKQSRQLQEQLSKWELQPLY